MTSVADEELLAHAERIRGKVMLITGGASGIGKATALLYAKYGAKVVIGDIDLEAATATVAGIIQAGGQATFRKCDVTVWEDQTALFELAVTTYGTVDVVIPNAGIASTPPPSQPLQTVDGRLVRPAHTLLDINLNAVVDTCTLAFHYFDRAPSEPGHLKAVVLVGSMASFHPLDLAPTYTASKHAVLGLMASLVGTCAARDIRLGSVHPWFVKTQLTAGPIDGLIKAAGIPYTPLARVAATMLCVATDPEQRTSGLPWTLPDGGGVFRLGAPVLNQGVYAALNERARDTVLARETAFLGQVKAKV